MSKITVVFLLPPLQTVHYPFLTTSTVTTHFLPRLQQVSLLPLPSILTQQPRLPLKPNLDYTNSRWHLLWLPSPLEEMEPCSWRHRTSVTRPPAHLSELMPCHAPQPPRPSCWAHTRLASVPGPFSLPALMLSQTFAWLTPFASSSSPMGHPQTLTMSDLLTYPKSCSSL